MRGRGILRSSSKEVATWHTKICHVAYMLCPVPALQSDLSSSRAPSVPPPSRERPGFSLACAGGPRPYTNFAGTAFSEVRGIKPRIATAKIRRLGDVPNLTVLVRYLPTSGRGPEPRPVECGHLGAWGASSATGCLLSPYRDLRGGKDGVCSGHAFFASYLTHPPLYTNGRIRKEEG